MGTCVEKLPHQTDNCNSSDGLQVFEADDGSYNGFCYACGTYVADPYKDKPADYKPAVIKKSPEEIAQELWEIGQYLVVDVEERGLRKDTLEYFGYRVGVSTSDGETPAILYRPYTKDGVFMAYKSKVLENGATWSIGDQREVDLFGWEQAIASGSPRLIITEGEEDAVAMFQILNDNNQKDERYSSYTPAVVSLPHGASGSVKDLSRLEPAIRRYFKEIVLAFDMDDVGQEWAHQVVEKVFGDAKIASLPAKDANACLVEGRSKALIKAVLFNAEVPRNTRIVKGSTLREIARKQPEWGLPWPFKKLTDLTRGRRRGEVYYFGAGVKMGKSELVDTIAKQIIVDDGLPCLLAKPEQAMGRTYQMLVGKAAGKIFHDPKIVFDELAFDKHEPAIGDKALIVDNYQFVDWENLKQDIRYAVLSEGVQDVIIDPITVFTNHMPTSEANEFLTSMTAEIASMAKDLNFTAYLFCHLKAPETGPPHERGGEIYSTQFAGSRAMMRTCHYMIGMEGNKDPSLGEDERNMRTLVVLEDREFGMTGKVPLFWDRNTGLFNEIET